MSEKKLFEETVVAKIREKIQNDGLEGVDIKELLVLVAAYFNDGIGGIQDGISGIQDGIGGIQSDIQKIGHGTRGALWAIFAGIIASLIAGLIIALLMLK